MVNGVALSLMHVFVSISNNFIHSSTAADQGFQAFGYLARFVYCLLQKIKKASSLPLVEQWEEHVVPNHSRFPAIDDKDFLAGTRVMVALDKVGSQYLLSEFRRDARGFLEEFVNCVLSTVASRSVRGQGLSCFCPAIVVGGDDVAPFQLFNKVLDGYWRTVGLGGAKWRRAGLSTSPLQEQWQLELSSTRSRPDVGTCIKNVSCPTKHVASTPINCLILPWASVVLGVPIDDTCDPWASNAWWEVHYQPGSCRHQRRRSACCPASCAGLCSEPALHTEKFLLGVRLDNVVWICCYRW